MVRTLYENENFIFFLQTLEKESTEGIPAENKPEKAGAEKSSTENKPEKAGAEKISSENKPEKAGAEKFSSENKPEKAGAEKTPAENRTAEKDAAENSRPTGSGARITRRAKQGGEEVVLFSYTWPVQLTVEIQAGEGTLRDDGVLCWELYVKAHHVRGMAKGEFTETEWFEVENPFGTAREMVCRTVDVVRKTRFAIAERHLGHMPHQTYPSVDGRQGPYGHP